MYCQAQQLQPPPSTSLDDEDDATLYQPQPFSPGRRPAAATISRPRRERMLDIFLSVTPRHFSPFHTMLSIDVMQYAIASYLMQAADEKGNDDISRCQFLMLMPGSIAIQHFMLIISKASLFISRISLIRQLGHYLFTLSCQ